MSASTVVSDGLVIAKRNLIKIKRDPEVLVFVLISPIMFVLLFAYVFGGAIGEVLPGVSYREFLIGGIFAQTVVFGATWTGAGIADDMQKGIIDRFRSLPMSRSAVLVGRTGSDILYNVITLVIMSLTGLLVGWRIRGSVTDAVIAYALLLFFAYGFSWVMAVVGLLVPNAEAVNNAGFVVIFPLTFIANTFVDSNTLPGPLEAFANWNPISTLTLAVRDRFGNLGGFTAQDVAQRAEAGWAMEHPITYTLIWTFLLIAVCAPLATALYRRTTSK